MVPQDTLSEADPASAGGPTPEAFLKQLRDSATQKYVTTLARYDEFTGLRTEIRNGVPVSTIIDRSAYRSFLARGLTESEIEKQLTFEDSIPLKTCCDGAAAYEERLNAIAEWSAKLTGNHSARLAGIPIGVAHVGYFSAGAAPAPFGGDVILLSSGLLYLRFWLAWMSILLKPSQEPETAKDLLLHALPDLAMQILAFRPFAKFTLFLEMANRRTDVMLGEELQNRAWLAESFIILHEFGHIALGHTDQVRNWKPGHLLTTKQLAQRRSLQRQWELEADGFAAEALGGITPVEDMAAAFDAVFQLFRCREEFECKSSDVDTHPTARQRHTQVMARFLDLKPEEVVQFSDHLELLRGGIDAHRRQRRHES